MNQINLTSSPEATHRIISMLADEIDNLEARIRILQIITLIASSLALFLYINE